MQHDLETKEQLAKAGPTAFVHVTSITGRPLFDPLLMAQGFAQMFITMSLVAATFWALRDKIVGFAARSKLLVLVALVAVAMIDLGQATWWQGPWDWKLCQAIYDFTGLVLGGAVVAAILPGPGR
jgi:hypothetical protein